MPRLVRGYVRCIDAMNRFIGRITMYLIFVLIGVLLWSSVSKTFFDPSLWTLEMAQFVMVAYYVLGGPYSIQLGSNVRMDLFYGSWTPRTKAWVDAFTVFFLIFYLGVLLAGGINSLAFSLGAPYNMTGLEFFKDFFATLFTEGIAAAEEKLGFMERSRTVWRPYLWPVKTLLCIGVFLMLLQCLAEFFKDVARIRGVEI